jgi:hypothetical protein
MSKITVRGRLAASFMQYRDDAEDIDRSAVDSYGTLAAGKPGALDAATLAIALKPHVRFTRAANGAFITALDGAKGDDDSVPFTAISPGIEARPRAQAIIAAHEHAGEDATALLAEACCLLFIEANPKLVTVDTRVQVTDGVAPYVDAEGSSDGADDGEAPDASTDDDEEYPDDEDESD